MSLCVEIVLINSGISIQLTCECIDKLRSINLKMQQPLAMADERACSL